MIFMVIVVVIILGVSLTSNQFQILSIHSVLGEKAECPRAEQLLNEVIIPNFTKN